MNLTTTEWELRRNGVILQDNIMLMSLSVYNRHRISL